LFCAHAIRLISGERAPATAQAILIQPTAKGQGFAIQIDKMRYGRKD
jgi:hypothetical protein